MTPEEELELALREVAKAKAELAAARADVEDAKAGKVARTPRGATPKKRSRRPVHRSEVRAGCDGTGERFTGPDKVRVDMQPIVMKDVSPFDRPVESKYEPVECLLVFDVKAGFMETDSWKRCRCVACAEIRRG